MKNVIIPPDIPRIVGDVFGIRERRDGLTDRPFTVTQLTAPTTQMALKLLYDYDVPLEYVLAAHGGIMADSYLLGPPREDEHILIKKEVIFERAGEVLFRGHPDLYEKDTKILYDLKFWGYRGRHVLEENGVELYAQQETWQLNGYRLALEQAGMAVKESKLLIWYSDSFPKVKINGEERKMFTVDILRFDDREVVGYFLTKRDSLEKALQSAESFEGIEPCPERDRWEKDKRCKCYCAVAPMCEYGRQFYLG